MRTVALLLALTACAPAKAAEPVLELRVGPQAIVATAEDIEGVAVMESHPPGLNIGVSARFSKAIAELTGASIGKEAQLSICGEEVSRPKIMERISGRNMVITPVPPEKVEGYLNVLSGKLSCPG